MASNRITPKKLGSAQAAIFPSTTTIRATPIAAKDIIKTIDICNTSSIAARVYLFLVDSGDTAGVDNAIIYGVTIDGYGVFQWTGTQIVEGGGSIQASASIAGVTVIASGGEVT